MSERRPAPARTPRLARLACGAEDVRLNRFVTNGDQVFDAGQQPRDFFLVHLGLTHAFIHYGEAQEPRWD